MESGWPEHKGGIPQEWDENGRVAAVAVLTHTEDMYGVDWSGRGERFPDLINADAWVDGYIDVGNGTKIMKIIRVTRYRIKRIRRWPETPQRLRDPAINKEWKEERTMKSVKTYVIMALTLIIMVVFPLAVTAADDTAASEPVTMVGVVNDNFQFIADNGHTYEVEITDAGNDLIDTVGQKVEVTAVVDEVDETRTMNVISFKVLEPKTQED
jgi:hypothetical protein